MRGGGKAVTRGNEGRARVKELSREIFCGVTGRIFFFCLSADTS